MLVHLNEQQRSCTCFKKGLQRNYCLSGYQVSLRDICLERYSKCTSLHQKIISLSKKNPALWSIKIPINSTLFDAQNAGNRISKLLDFKFFWGSKPPDPPTGKAPYGPFCGHSRLLHFQWPLITNVIETPAL